ncbi:MAG: response regulator [Candidatus Dadabacteria bacterium]|nr:MAG: response regulator [Candidatus Dadabacteria bacterium]
MITTLVVDDSVIALKLAKKAYGDICDIDCASDLGEAITLLTNKGYDLFLIDYKLPSGNGLDLIRTIRAMPEYGEKTVIFLISSGMTNELAYAAMKAGANDSFSKSEPPSKIKEAILAQIEKPEIRYVHLDYLITRCVAWMKDNVHYQYSPESGDLVSGPDAERVHMEMERRLFDYYSKGHDVAIYGDDIKLITHSIRLDKEK